MAPDLHDGTEAHHDSNCLRLIGVVRKSPRENPAERCQGLRASQTATICTEIEIISIPAKTRLKPLRIIEPVLRREIGIISLRGQPLTLVAQRFAELVEELLAPGPRK